MYYFVVNPAAKSGHGLKVWNEIKKALDGRGIEYELHTSKAKGDINSTVSKLTHAHKNDPDPIKLVIIGGDGTLNEAVQDVADYSKLHLGFIPAGSANDYAKNTGISTRPLEALDQILKCKEPVLLDMGHMTYDDEDEPIHKIHYFASSCGIGYDAAVSKASLDAPAKDILNKIRMGNMIYLIEALKTLAKLERGDCTVTLDDRDVIEVENFLFICSTIFEYEGGGFRFSPGADPQDGKFNVCVFGRISKPKVLVALPTAYTGTSSKYEEVELYLASKVHIKASMPFWIQLDGEVDTKSAEITAYCRQRVLRLLK